MLGVIAWANELESTSVQKKDRRHANDYLVASRAQRRFTYTNRGIGRVVLQGAIAHWYLG